MEWIQRNPKTAVALSAFVVLVVIFIVWGMSRDSGNPSAEPTLGGPPLTSPSESLTVLPTPSGVPTSVTDVLNALPGAGAAAGSDFGSGSSKSLESHRVVVSAESDGPLMATGWWIPLADGERKGGDTSQKKTFRHSDVSYGDGDLARIISYGGPYSTKTWCTITVDGKVVDRQMARNPYGYVLCQG